MILPKRGWAQFQLYREARPSGIGAVKSYRGGKYGVRPIGLNRMASAPVIAYSVGPNPTQHPNPTVEERAIRLYRTGIGTNRIVLATDP